MTVGENELNPARRLVAEAISLCDLHGHGIAAAHLQLGLDLIEQLEAERETLREERSPWHG